MRSKFKLISEDQVNDGVQQLVYRLDCKNFPNWAFEAKVTTEKNKHRIALKLVNVGVQKMIVRKSLHSFEKEGRNSMTFLEF